MQDDVSAEEVYLLTMMDLDCEQGALPLNVGAPGPDQLIRVKDMIGQATQALQVFSISFNEKM